MVKVKTPDWSGTLVDRIAHQDFVLFIGAGISSNSKNSLGQSPPRWKELLESLKEEFVANHRTTLAAVNKAIRSGDLLSAAELIEHHCEEKGRLDDFRSEIVRLTDGDDSDKASLLFQKNDLHDIVAELFPRIMITTNYDTILERHFTTGYKTLTYEKKDIASYIRQGKYVLVKLHGCASDPAHMILTRMDFTRLRKEGNNTLDMLEALLLTKTALFVGYSLDDPDLRLLLENQFGAKGAPPGHYLLASDKTSDVHKALLKTAYGVNVLEYSGDHGVGVKQSLRDLADLVNSARSTKGLSIP